jgi:hypothetical protein
LLRRCNLSGGEPIQAINTIIPAQRWFDKAGVKFFKEFLGAVDNSHECGVDYFDRWGRGIFQDFSDVSKISVIVFYLGKDILHG